ncbi:HIT domain-containing protein [Bacillus amyloliquefaciens]|uniref:HIT domain-containing protein n=1 Tax=Bacillus amyloliquefaciens TaxID=1390 RepID=UPI0022AEBA88|nr:HIT domain-containing protein [Bacillus amyloliquefaciens]MCZ4248886.1 HIT domain-containing protein [Bacillus amyloliquefaciens]
MIKLKNKAEHRDEVLSGKTKVNKVLEIKNVLAYHHTKPFWPVHIVAIPKKHISSLKTLEEDGNELLLKLLGVIKKVTEKVTKEIGFCRVLTKSGDYWDSKNMH